MVRIMEEVMMRGMEEGVLTQRGSPRSKKWLDQEVNEKRKQTARLWIWGKTTHPEDDERKRRTQLWNKKKNEYF